MLASIALDRALGMKRTEVEAGDGPRHARLAVDHARQAPVNQLDIPFVVATAGHAALIGHDHERESGGVKSLHSASDSGEELNLRGIPAVAVVGHEGVVPIEEDGAAHGVVGTSGDEFRMIRASAEEARRVLSPLQSPIAASVRSLVAQQVTTSPRHP